MKFLELFPLARLFIDAANTELSILKRQFRIPSRMVLLGLPGVIIPGFGFAVLIFDGLTLVEAAMLATMPAATDAAHGISGNPPARWIGRKEPGG